MRDGQGVEKGQILVEWDPYTFSILTEEAGTVHFKDIIENLTYHEQVDEVTGLSQWVIIDSQDEKRLPTIIVRPEGGTRHDEKRYLLPTNAHLLVRDGSVVHAGDVLAKMPRATTKTKDITGGLPRVVELFEARKPHEAAVMSEINGVVRIGDVVKGYRRVTVAADDARFGEPHSAWHPVAWFGRTARIALDHHPVIDLVEIVV